MTPSRPTLESPCWLCSAQSVSPPATRPGSSTPGPLHAPSSFNPALPEDGALIIASVLRDQFIALHNDTQTRATEAELDSAVGVLDTAIAQRVTQAAFNDAVSAVNAAIDERATTAQLDTAVSGLTAQIDERVTETELNEVVNGLNIAIDQRITRAQLNTGMDVATNNAINTTLPQTSANSNGVGALSVQAFSYYDQYQFQQVIDKIDELINALRR